MKRLPFLPSLHSLRSLPFLSSLSPLSLRIRRPYRAHHIRPAQQPSQPAAQPLQSDQLERLPQSDTPSQWAPIPFEEATDVADLMRRRRNMARQLLAMRAVVAVLLAAALCIGGYPLVLQYRSDRQLESTASQAAQTVAEWPYPQAEESLAAARAYNERLAQSGQPVMGEAVDPFAQVQGGSRASNEEDSEASKDEEYQGLLDTGGGVMGSILIPSISVDLPIYHGTSESALASGAGHLYGSSLPVGGENTHAVLTGHRGLVEALMFTRLDEMEVGDFFYIEVMGETLGYRVDRITVIDPDDTSQLKVVEGEDRVTLMTCTPYGVNTQRLLVSGVRQEIPMPIPDPQDAPPDVRTLVVWAVAIVAVPGLIFAVVFNRRRTAPWRQIRHASRWPR
ncbi:class C sortase [Bifidobacterium lemurum]|nr:class C sortase [Bifidobacterium lemurum]